MKPSPVAEQTAWRGVVVPMISPRRADGSIDSLGLHALAAWLVDEGMHGLFILGTTGECLACNERDRIALMAALPRTTTLCCVGVSAADEGSCLGHLAAAAAHGMDAGVVHQVPGMDAIEAERWLERIADRSPLPLLLYNIPMVTGGEMPADCAMRLCRHPRIVGYKDSSPDRARHLQLIPRIRELGRPHLIGAMGHASAALAAGSDGMVPSGANLDPTIYRRMWQAALARDWAGVEELQQHASKLSSSYQAGRPLAASISALRHLAQAQVRARVSLA